MVAVVGHLDLAHDGGAVRRDAESRGTGGIQRQRQEAQGPGTAVELPKRGAGEVDLCRRIDQPDSADTLEPLTKVP